MYRLKQFDLKEQFKFNQQLKLLLKLSIDKIEFNKIQKIMFKINKIIEYGDFKRPGWTIKALFLDYLIKELLN